MSGASPSRGFAGRLAARFIDSRLTVLAVLASVLAGAYAVLSLPREEEPQIQVPMIDLHASLPGASAAEVQRRVTEPLERLARQVGDVEYVYSTSSPGESLVIVRFLVGTPLDEAADRLRRTLSAQPAFLPPDATGPLVRPRVIDDVPILALTFHGKDADPVQLRAVALAVADSLKSVPEVAETEVIGGLRRTVRVQLDPARLAAAGATPGDVATALASAGSTSTSGALAARDAALPLDVAPGLRTVSDVAATRLALPGATLTVGDIARVSDRGEEPSRLVFHGAPGSDLEPAVTLTVAKRPGANAVQVVAQALAKVEELRGRVIPAEISVEVTRDYGRTAAEKSNELLLHMGIAVFGVTLLILLFLGWRESIVVLLAIPATLALTLLLFHQLGYTLNRITLFALIFSIGILVDDAIVVVENLVRHFRMPGSRDRPVSEVALEAVDEVGNPTILATWAVIAAILPMAFVGGLMGPYMRPIPVGASVAMVFSLLVAFTVTPWAAIRVIGRRATSLAPGSDVGHGDEAPNDLMTRLYRRYMEPLMGYSTARWKFLSGIALLLILSMALVPLGAVKIKMLPFDNKSEFQVVVRLPEGASLERTSAAVRDLTRALADVPEVRGWQAYLGTSAPFNFNGLVRHYYLRQGPNVADIQVNLVHASERSDQSHEVAKRVRERLLPVARAHDAILAVAEVPPGPPVLQTLVAEVYGPDETHRLALAAKVKETLAGIDGVVDVDWYVESPHRRARLEIDADEAARLGVSRATVAELLALGAGGRDVARLAEAVHPEPVPVRLELDPAWRQSPEAVLALPVRLTDGSLAPAAAFARAFETEGERSLYRKNLRAVTYVTADVAGAIESPAYALLEAQRRLAALDAREFGATEAALEIHHLSQPSVEGGPALKWDGEWHITLEVFRDLGVAFAAVLILIYGLMVGWFGNYRTPLVVMAAIPFSLIGILPAHALMGAFFTATSMIGFMAGAGIVVRNSIILVDFIELRRSQGLPLEQAVVEAGAVRFRPMLLTALAVVIGAAVILADPIFQGLAISLLFGEIASLFISRMAVPVLYLMAERRA